MGTNWMQWPKAAVYVGDREITLWAGRDAVGRVVVVKRHGGEDNEVIGERFGDLADAQVWVLRKTGSLNLAEWLALALAA
jgi:hypothetical protein